MTFAGLFGILVGVGMLAQWSVSFFNRQIPELKTEPLRIGFHLAGEILTAVCLFVSGIGLLSGSAWAPGVYLVACGMLLCTAIVSPGYFAQKGQYIWLVIFGALVVITVINAILVGSRLADL